MKKICYLIFLFSFEIFAQNEVFRIDSLPQQGVLLDKGWKFHVGDNPDFAKPDFDDSQWESIDPTKDVMDFNKIKRGKIVWLRLNIDIKSLNKGGVLALAVKQTCASEIYLNSTLIGKYGNVSNKLSQIKGYDPMGQIIPFPSKPEFKNILSIRLVIPDLFFVKHFYFSNPLFKVILNRIENIYDSTDRINALSLNSHIQGYFKAGLFFIFSILHFCFYFFYPKRKANLLLGLYAFFTFLLIFAENISYFLTDLETRNNLSFSLIWLHNVVLLIGLKAIYSLLNFKRDLVYKICSITAFIGIPLMYRPYLWGQFYGILIPTLLISLAFLYISVRSFRSGNSDAKGLIIASLLILVCYPSYHLYKDFFINHYQSEVFRGFTFNIAILALPFSMSYYIAKEFTSNYKKIDANFKEFEKLSQEKQETLQRQNTELQAALLKGQTIERQRVALDLHDNLGSTLSALWLSVDTIDKSKMNVEEKAIHQNLRENLEKAYNDVRLLSHNLLPEEFEKQGLTIILQGFVRKMNKNSAIKFDLKISENFGRVNNKIEFELYSICLELVNNIIKHSKATEAKIELSRNEKQILFIVSDNGIGTFKNDSDGKGMKNVKARVESLNGVWELQSVDNEGVKNKVLIPT